MVRDDYESGPFCQHWCDPHDCDVLCKCGHPCCKHPYGDCDDCPCEEFQDADDEGEEEK